jgi:hypothetical protein
MNKLVGLGDEATPIPTLGFNRGVIHKLSKPMGWCDRTYFSYVHPPSTQVIVAPETPIRKYSPSNGIAAQSVETGT